VKVVAVFPRPVRRIEHCWIPLPDGCRLAARVWLPEDAETSPVPAIVEYIPYRKRDFTRTRDEPMHHYFAGHGYAAVRVDVRGSGESDGVLLDEYAEQELADGVAVIGWLAAQPWCTGAVGMIGKSWGGINVLEIAARRPPALRAIITVCGSEDRYADDAHYMGGCLLNENLTWGSMLLTSSALPPDPALVGERWRALWLARLDHAVLFPEIWLRHQRRDAYWRRADLERISCAVYAVGGWADAYTNAVPRLLTGLTAPRKGLIGPWAHVYPHTGSPGPAIGFLQEALRWWDQWLKEIETGVLDEPLFRIWMHESHDGGRWVAEATWPSPRIMPKRLALGPGRLLEEAAGPETSLAWRSPQSIGLAAGDWCSFGGDDDAPTDQRDDDGGSLSFDSAPLGERLEILGAPVADLELAVDRPEAFVAVRLNEIRPDGSSVRVTYGVLNLTHRTSHEHPEALEPGRRYRVRVALNHIAHAFAARSRLRLAVSTAYWPVVWPSVQAVALTLFTGASGLELPVRPPAPGDDRLKPFEEPEGAPPAAYVELRPRRVERTVERDEVAGEIVYAVVSEGGQGRMEEIDLELEQSSVRRYRIQEHDPLTARAEVVQRMGLRRGPWAVAVESRVWLSATEEAFALRARLEAFEGDALVRSRSWDCRVARDGS
jgi:putative CocE/NonD family hydrolase